MRDGDNLHSVALALGTAEAAINILNPEFIPPGVGSTISLPSVATCRGELSVVDGLLAFGAATQCGNHRGKACLIMHSLLDTNHLPRVWLAVAATMSLVLVSPFSFARSPSPHAIMQRL
jgi:hypothetical protein